MTNQTTENFWQVFNSYKWPEPVKFSYRLYYNDDGTPKCYSMEELADKYVEVDAETFAARPWNIRVVEDKITFIEPPVTVKKLKPNQVQGTACHPKDVCVVVDIQQPNVKWNLKTNEIS
jgi:hypothetical protein